MNDYALSKPKRIWQKIIVLIMAVVLVSGLIAGIAAHKTYRESLQPVSATGSSQVITIPVGSTAKEIASQLESAGLIRRAWAFDWYLRTNGLRGQLQAGTFALKPTQSVEEIVAVLTKGKEASDLVTIFPVKRIDEVRDDLINQGFDAAAVDAALEPARYNGHPALAAKPAEANLEGYLYPESFHRTATTTPDDIIRASLDQLDSHITPEIKAGFERQNLTTHQAIILASIIEQEVGNSDPVVDLEDKKKVAQVFLRRLRESHPLESDATAGYGAILAGADPSKPFSSPYNTYQNKGLTPTPISNVSKHALMAVAEPAQTNYFYFVSGDDDVNYFSDNLEEHRRLTRQYCSGCP
jgi:UPF0755 protein